MVCHAVYFYELKKKRSMGCHAVIFTSKKNAAWLATLFIFMSKKKRSMARHAVILGRLKKTQHGLPCCDFNE